MENLPNGVSMQSMILLVVMVKISISMENLMGKLLFGSVLMNQLQRFQILTIHFG